MSSARCASATAAFWVFGGARQRIQARQTVFHLLERGERRLAVIGDGFLIGGLRGGEIGAIASAIEDGLQQVSAQRPECAGSADQRTQADALEAAAAGNGELRIERGSGNSHERIFVGHGSFGGGNVGPALQQIRRHSQRNWRRNGAQRRDRNVKCGRGISRQRRDGMFKLRALLLQQIELRDRGVEQRLLLRDIQS